MTNLSNKLVKAISSDRKQNPVGTVSYEHESSAIPIVSVCMITYNHRDFIEQALDSVLMQETNFPVEIILHDDCSTDGTTDIVGSYAERHPGIIRPIYQDENQFSKGEKISPKTFRIARGKYIALLEGDDAWADPQKLRRQVEFLEEHKGCIICYGNAKVIDAQGNVLRECKVPDSECRHLTQKEIIECRHVMPTATVMFRNHPILRRLPKEFNKVVNGDSFLFALLGQYGTAGYLDFMPSLYRKHPGGIYSSRDEVQRRVARLNTHRMLHVCIKKEYRTWVAGIVASVYMSHLDYMRRNGRKTKLIRNILSFLWFSVRHRRLSDLFRDFRGCFYQLRKAVMLRAVSVP